MRGACTAHRTVVALQVITEYYTKQTLCSFVFFLFSISITAGRYFRLESLLTRTRKRLTQRSRSSGANRPTTTPPSPTLQIFPKRCRKKELCLIPLSLPEHFNLIYLLNFIFFSIPKTPIELAIDFILHDFEMAGHLFIFA